MGSSYNRQIIKQCEEQALTIEKLQADNLNLQVENRALRKEVLSLNGRLCDLERTLEARIEAAVAKATAPLYAQIAKRDIEIMNSKLSDVAKNTPGFQRTQERHWIILLN